MTRSLMARLFVALAALAALIAFALQPTGDPTTTVAAASRGAMAQDRSGTQPTATQLAGTVTMTVLHNNDGESKLLANTEGGFPGIARFAQAWIELGRASDADILLRVSAGDNFLASKEFSAGLAREGRPLYDSIALRGLYEVMGFGNHDFDFGPDVTARFIEGFEVGGGVTAVPFVAANLDVSAEPALQRLADSGRIAPSVVFADPSSGLEVGVIGAITPRLTNISSPRNVVVDSNVADAVNAQVVALEDRGVDRIVLVSHLQGLPEDRELVPQLSGVDIVVAGGGDELLRNDGDSCQPDEAAVDGYPLVVEDADGVAVPVVTAPGGYRCIGRLDVVFDADGTVIDFRGSSIGVALDGQAEAFAMSRVEEPLALAVADLEATVVGSSEVELDGRRNSVRTRSANVGELLADALLAAGSAADAGAPAQVAVQNGGGIRNDAVIPAGDITAADTFDIAPFANFVVTGTVPRERFRELLEVAVAGLPDAEGTFPQIAGFTLEVDPSQPARAVDADGDCSVLDDAGSRVRTVTLDDGTEIVTDGAVVPGDDLTLATIDFLANGGDCYPLPDLEFSALGVSYQQALSDFVVGPLDGMITASDYPEGGVRITVLDAAGNGGDSGDDGSAASDDTEQDATAVDTVQDPDDTVQDPDDTDLPNTGVNTWLIVIVSATIAAAGVLIALEAQRAGRLSVLNRLVATRAWIPPDTTNTTTDDPRAPGQK